MNNNLIIIIIVRARRGSSRLKSPERNVNLFLSHDHGKIWSSYVQHEGKVYYYSYYYIICQFYIILLYYIIKSYYNYMSVQTNQNVRVQINQNSRIPLNTTECTTSPFIKIEQIEAELDVIVSNETKVWHLIVAEQESVFRLTCLSRRIQNTRRARSQKCTHKHARTYTGHTKLK